jgi:hypothetical protein
LPAALINSAGNSNKSPARAKVIKVTITHANRCVGMKSFPAKTASPSPHTTDVCSIALPQCS